MAVRVRFGGQAGADAASGAGAVLDHEGLPERRLQMILQEP
jgi:hypothetical protein